MKYKQLFQIFNTIIDVVGDDPILDKARYDELKTEHAYLYAFEDHYIGVTVTYQIKEGKVEPMYSVTPVAIISGHPFAIMAPSDEVARIKEVLFTQWKQGDAEFNDLFPSENQCSKFGV